MLTLEGGDTLSKWDALVKKVVSPYICLFVVLGLHGGRAAMDDALLRQIVIAVEIKKIGILNIPRSQKRMIQYIRPAGHLWKRWNGIKEAPTGIDVDRS